MPDWTRCQHPRLQAVQVLGASGLLCAARHPRVVRWLLDRLCGLQEHCSRLQHTLRRGSSLLADLLLVVEDV